jgi:pimeloyl-ACP methyl ester carboxylesterase
MYLAPYILLNKQHKIISIYYIGHYMQGTTPHWRVVTLITALVTLFTLSTPVQAESLRLTSPDGKPLNAEFKPGDTQQPAILVLHGFLQTREFLTTQTIINGLSSIGNAILSPNLSLGVPDRQQSMQCQAPHQNTFEGDLREIDLWVQWLRKHGYPSVIIVGHSWGSQHGLGYAEAYPKTPIAALINVSLVRTEQTTQAMARQSAAAKARMARHDTKLQPYAVSFCKEYMATPESYLSYARWSDVHVLSVLARLKTRQVPVYVVLGSQDNRSDGAWVKALRVSARQVAVVEGANHFFSSLHEFELNEHLEVILAQLKSPTQR